MKDYLILLGLCFPRHISVAEEDGTAMEGFLKSCPRECTSLWRLNHLLPLELFPEGLVLLACQPSADIVSMLFDSRYCSTSENVKEEKSTA